MFVQLTLVQAPRLRPTSPDRFHVRSSDRGFPNPVSRGNNVLVRNARLTRVGLTLLWIGPVACSSPKMETPGAERGLKVAAIEIGRAVGDDKRVSSAVDTFHPEDTVF